MCGRYFIGENLVNDLQAGGYGAVEELGEVKKGEFFPSDRGIIIHENRRLCLGTWGFPLGQSSQIIINARAESLRQSPMFSRAFEEARIVIPMTHFFEWSRAKDKYTIGAKDKDITFVAGLAKRLGGILYYTMETRDSNPSMEPIHSRMPLVIREDMVDPWLRDPAYAKEILAYIPEALDVSTDYEQQSLL